MKPTLPNPKEELSDGNFLTEQEVEALLFKAREDGRIGREYLKELKAGKR